MNQLAFVVAWAFHWPAHRVAQEGEEKRDLLRRRRATERAGTASPGLWSSSPGRVVKERQRERGVEVRQEEGAQYCSMLRYVVSMGVHFKYAKCSSVVTYGHTLMRIPHPVRSAKSSICRLSQ